MKTNREINHRSTRQEADALIRKFYRAHGSGKIQKQLYGWSRDQINRRASRIGVSYKKRQGTQPWKCPEIKLLKKHYPEHGAVGMKQFLPHRSKSAIYHQARCLGLRMKEDYKAPVKAQLEKIGLSWNGYFSRLRRGEPKEQARSRPVGSPKQNQEVQQSCD